MTDLNTQPKIAVVPESFEIRPSSNPDSSVSVTNVSFVPILYRALSTAPRQFQVRPRQGVIESGKTEIISITYSTKAEQGADGSAAAAVPSGERKEEFKIEYCKMTPDHEDAISNANGNPSVVTDLIKACSRSEKKSKVITCVIFNTNASQQQQQEQAAPATVVEREKDADAALKVTEAAAKSAAPAPATVPARGASARDANTDVLLAAGTTAPATAATSAVVNNSNSNITTTATTTTTTAASTTSGADADEGLRSRASGVASSARPSTAAPVLPPKKDAPVTFAADPLGFLKQNPLVAVGIFIGLYLIAKLLF